MSIRDFTMHALVYDYMMQGCFTWKLVLLACIGERSLCGLEGKCPIMIMIIVTEGVPRYEGGIGDGLFGLSVSSWSWWWKILQ